MADILARLGIIGAEDEEKRKPVIEEFSISGIAKYIQSDKCKIIF